MNTGCEQENKIIKIQLDGTCETTEHAGSATVIVEESSAIDKQKTAYYIETAHIASLIIEHSTKVIFLPLGSDVELAVILQDIYGRSFSKCTK